MNQPEIQKHGITRREFLKTIFTLIAIAPLLRRSMPEPKEGEPKPWENIIIIDFTPGHKIKGLEIEGYWTPQKFIKEALDTEIPSEAELLWEFGTDIVKVGSEAQKELLAKYPEYALARGAIEMFDDHSETVSYAARQAWKIFDDPYNPERLITVIDIQRFIVEQEFLVEKDELGNWRVTLTLPPEGIVKALQDHTDMKVINFSFQVGKLGFTYEVFSEGELFQKLEVAPEDGTKLFVPIPYGFVGDLAKEERLFDEKGREFEKVTQEEAGRIQQSNPDIEVRFASTNRIDKNGNTTMELTCYIIPKDFKGKVVKRTEYFLPGEETPLPKMSENQINIYIENNRGTIELMSPHVKRAEGYTQERAEESLTALFKICKTYPDKLFCAAGGNIDSDIREARRQLKDSWPPNLLLIAEWRTDAPAAHVYGSDIYVDTNALEIMGGSSHATPVISAIASDLITTGMRIDQVKARIASFCKKVEFTDHLGQSQIATVLDPKKVSLKA